MGAYIWNGLEYLDLVTGDTLGGFVPGVTEPFYEVKADYSGKRNIGTRPGTGFTTYDGPIVGGVAQLLDAGLYEDLIFPCVVEPRAAVTLRNCRVIVPPTYTTTSDSIKAAVRCLNGTNTTNILIENCEIHNRAQRPLNGITGRNYTMRRTAITGVIDGWSDAAGGSAPQGWGYVVEDSMVPSIAWWYSPTINSDIHSSDQGSHSDVFQKTTALQGTVRNSVLCAYVDDLIGTGTPGSGRDDGNPYVPPGYDYNASQSLMEGWRTSFTRMSDASQTKYGVSRRLATEGSLAPVMVNAGALDLDRCQIAGGTVGINASSTSLPTVIDMRLTNNTFWNDMANGHERSGVYNAANKGHAILSRAGKSFEAFTGNRWASELGGALLAPVTEGAFLIYR